MARALRDVGAEVHVLTFPRPGLDSVGESALRGVKLHTVHLKKGTAAYPAYNCRALRHSMGVYEALEPRHARERFEVSEFPDFGGEAYFSMRARRAMGCFDDTVLAIRCHTPIAVCKQFQGNASLNRSDVIVEHMERFCLGEADRITAPSAGVLRAIGTQWPRLGDVLGVAPVFANPMQTAGAARKPSVASSGLTVLFSGRLEWLKGPDLLIEAAQELFEEGLDFQLRLIGRDTKNSPSGVSMRRTLRQSVDRRWRKRIVFEPPVSRDALLDVLGTASVVVVPSRYENQSYAIAEAMAMGRCVVASDVGGTPELIEDGVSGVLFQSSDVGDLKRALRNALTDAGLRARVGDGAQARVGEFLDPTRAAKTWMDVQGSVVGREASQPEPSSALVSILMPHYNAGAFLEESIASARAQTHAKTEIIVVDDGSDDEQSLKALDRVERAGHARVVRMGHEGVSAARNRAIEEARGEFVLMLDADDIAEPKLVARCLEALQRNPGSSYVSPLIADFVDNPQKPTGGWIPLGLDRDILWVMNVASAGTGAFLRREALLEVGGYDEAIPAYEDWDLFCTLCERGYEGEIIPEFLIRYRQSPGSLMQSAGKPHHGALHAYVIAKHPGLAERPDVSLRLMLSQAERARQAARDPE